MMPVAAILVDWGTSNLRLWAVDPNGAVLGERKSDAGMRTLEAHQFKAVFDEIVGQLGGQAASAPTIMCGMVGSQQGWLEAPYVAIPASFDTLVEAARRIEGVAGRDIRILPGVALIDAVAPDVMRSEETQLFGLQALHQSANANAERLVCMPGSHSKWAVVNQRQIKSFHTAMTGELIAAAMASTVLRHSFESTSLPAIGADNQVFLAAVDKALADPASILNAIFVTRSRKLLSGANPDESAAWLSGSIIGHDVAAALNRYGRRLNTILLGGGKQGPLYQAAMRRAGLEPAIVEADDASIAGLLKAARTIWPSRFETAPSLLHGAVN